MGQCNLNPNILRQGDTYILNAQIQVEGVGVLGVDSVDEVEFMLGNVRKMYPTDVTFDTDHFVIPLTQQETFGYLGKGIPCQARVLFSNGQVKGTEIIRASLTDSISEEVLS